MQAENTCSIAVTDHDYTVGFSRRTILSKPFQCCIKSMTYGSIIIQWVCNGFILDSIFPELDGSLHHVSSSSDTDRHVKPWKREVWTQPNICCFKVAIHAHFKNKRVLTDYEYSAPEGQSDPGVENSVSVHHPLHEHRPGDGLDVLAGYLWLNVYNIRQKHTSSLNSRC